MGRMILNGTVYGAGSKVEANPDETATDELKKIDIDGTIYNIAGGTINVYGAFIDTSKILLPETRISGNGSYTAQEDCFITLLYYLGNWATNVALDNENIISANNMTPNCWNYVIFPVKKGQELTYNLGYNGWLKIYGVKGGSNPISAPIIYSTEEREVGVWHDNKPLYEKGVIITGLGTSRGYTDFPLNVSNAEIKTVEGCYWYPDGTTRKYGDVIINASGVLDTNYTLQAQAINNNTIRITYAQDRSTSTGFVRVRYTKTTDTAGSGSYNTLGVPNVHYSTDEQVIGTWIDGKPLYQKTIELNNIIVGYNNEFHTQIAHNVSDFKECHYLSMGCPRLGISSGDVLFSSNSSIIATFRVDDTYIYATGGNNYFGASSDRYWYFTIQYTKTTD